MYYKPTPLYFLAKPQRRKTMASTKTSKDQKEPKKTKELVKTEIPYAEPDAVHPDIVVPDRSIFKENPYLHETEFGNTFRLTWIYAALIFSHHELKKWFCWDKKRWAADTTNKAIQYLIHVLLKDT
jgi:hypothetical protein